MPTSRQESLPHPKRDRSRETKQTLTWRAASELTNLGILVELVSNDVVNREDDADVALLGLLNETCDLLRAGLVEEGIADLW